MTSTNRIRYSLFVVVSLQFPPSSYLRTGEAAGGRYVDHKSFVLFFLLGCHTA